MKRRDSAAADEIVGSPTGVDRAACCVQARRSRAKSCSVALSWLHSRWVAWPMSTMAQPARSANAN